MRGLFAPGGPRLGSWRWGHLRPHHYNLIAIDVPWPFDLYDEETGNEKSASAHYETMSLDQIRALPVLELADPAGCLLLCWITAPLIIEGTAMPVDWGFKVRSFLHWRKVFPSGKPAMGPGYRVRTMGELCIVATLGNPKHEPLRGDFAGIRREHSRKPEEFYQLLDRHCRSLKRRADVFARQSRPGWDTWGNESDKFDGAAPCKRPRKTRPPEATVSDGPLLRLASSSSPSAGPLSGGSSCHD